MTVELDYPYASGDRLNDRNSYFYTPAVGAPMLQAWINVRAEVLRQLPPADLHAPQARPGTFEPDADIVDMEACMEWLWGRLSQGEIDGPAEAWLNRLVRKFETVKRFHRTYDARFLAVNKALYNDLGLYVRGAEIMLRAYQLSRRLPFLNALHKVIDTLCSAEQGLDPEYRARLARLIRAEHLEVMVLLEGR